MICRYGPIQDTQENRPPNDHQRSDNTDTEKHVFYITISDDDFEADPEEYIPHYPHGCLVYEKEPDANTSRRSPRPKDTSSLLDKDGLAEKIKELEAKIDHLQDRLKKIKNYPIYNI